MEHSGAFVAWLQAHGAYISPKIAIKDYSSEGARLGIVALEDIHKDEVLFTVPRTCLLNRTSSAFREEIRQRCKRIGWVPLIWAIMLERLSGAASFWKPYFDVLPDKISLPSIWSDEDRRLLVGTGIDALIPDSSRQFQKYFLPLKDVFPLTASLTDETFERHFHYAGCLISAYSFCEDAERQLDISMVPLADTLNHRTGHNNARLYFEPEALRMLCHQDCVAGDQLFNTYGDLGNRDLLLRYGFVDDPNPVHSVVFDPVEWLRGQVAASAISTGKGGSRVADSDEASARLFAKFDGVLDCELHAKGGVIDEDGLRPLLDWIHLLVLPCKTPLATLKPRRDHSVLLQTHGEAIVAILRARRACYPIIPDSREEIARLAFGPRRLALTIILQDVELLDDYIRFLEDE